MNKWYEDFNCDSCNKPFKVGDPVYNVGDAIDVIIFCVTCYNR